MVESSVIELDKEEFERTITRCENLVVVMFFTNSCPNCRAMEPIYRQVKDEIGDVADLSMINAQRYQEIAFKYGVQSVPTFKFFCKGSPIGEIVGAVNKTILRNTIKDFASFRQKCVKGSSKMVYELTGYA